jgi:hypothetical protein
MPDVYVYTLTPPSSRCCHSLLHERPVQADIGMGVYKCTFRCGKHYDKESSLTSHQNACKKFLLEQAEKRAAVRERARFNRERREEVKRTTIRAKAAKVSDLEHELISFTHLIFL